MSTNYSAHLIIGQRIPATKIVKKSKVRGCDHGVGHASKFCDQCGRPVWKESETIILDTCEDPPKGLSYVETGYDEEECIYVCAVDFEVHDSYAVTGERVRGATENDLIKVKDFLEPLGLWNEKEFGQWLVLQVS